MIIRHIGHAEFYMESENGYRIITDPYDASCGYPVKPLEADLALVSHGHHDHNAVENVKGSPSVIDRAGVYTPCPDIQVTALRGFHDQEAGAKRGTTLLFLIETEGLRIVHLGDLGCALSEEQRQLLHNPDILMIPVGGFYTIDGKTACETAEMLEARIILPMHYKTSFTADWPISGPEVFLQGMTGKDVLQNAEALRVTAGDIDCQPRVVLFRQ